MLSRKSVRRLALAGGLILTSTPAFAATSTWSGAASSDWSGANWDAAPVDGSDLVFNTFAGSQPTNNDLLSSVNSLSFGTAMPAAGVTIGGNALTVGAGGIINANTTASRNVTINNNLTIGAVQNWNIANDSDAITIIAGNLSGSANVTLSNGPSSNSSTPAVVRLTGSNSAFTGSLIMGGSSRGMLLGSASAMTGGLINIASGNDNLWLTGGAGSGTYVFGIAGTEASGPRVQFRGAGTAGIYLTSGDVTWDPGNGGNYNWSGASGTTIDFNGSNASAPLLLNLGNSSSQFIVSGASKTFRNAGGGNNPGYVKLLSALADGNEGTARTLTSSAGLLILTQDAVNTSVANPLRVTVSSGATAISDIDQLPKGNLTLSGGVLILDNVSWSTFAGARTLGTGNDQWQITGSGGGFAARNADVTIDTTGTTNTTFNRDFALGSAAREPGGTAMYANNRVIISQDIALSAARTITLGGGNAEATTNWTVNSPIHEISGKISGTGGLNIRGINRSSAVNGTLRLSNATNDFVGAVNIVTGTNEGGAIVIVTDDGALGNAANAVQVGTGSNGAGGMLLFENTGAVTKDFSRNFTVGIDNNGSGGDSGFGSWGGNVRYGGTIALPGTAIATKTSVPVLVQSGVLSFNSAVINQNSTSGPMDYNKGGAGEVVLAGLTINHTTGWRWQLHQGTMTASAAAEFASGAFDVDNLFNRSNTNVRQLNIVDNVTLDFSGSSNGGGFTKNLTLDVAAGKTLTTSFGTNELVSAEWTGTVSGFDFWISKTGDGTWIYSNTETSPLASGRNNGAIRAIDGTFDVTGNMGRTGLWLDGGTILVGNYSPFNGTSQDNRLQVSPNGGKLGMSPTASASTTRGISWDGTNNIWNLGGTGTVTLASRDSYSLIFSMSAFPNINAGETILIERDGTGTGVVQINDTAWTIDGTIGGSGALKLGASGTGTLTVNGTVSPGSSPGELEVQGNVVYASTASLAWDLDQAGLVGLLGSNDLLTVAGNLTLDGTLNVAEGGSFGVGTYRLINYTGSLTDNTLDLQPAFVSAWPGSYIDTATAGQVDLVVIPEPTALALLGVPALLALRRRRA